ncbi:tyrosine-type recombinase/integrase [Methylobacterium brachiatum]|uniref:tyrosine-type recombinase/integrase n=1 Tax=Methylobacterium brachiatum TaxID=269660 RepID=UPI0008E98056|nr:tyrosine-type recombinase/integrase [Methylobacterium brachiatum]SFJ69063.1 Phage integrase family protein [Methylobacterium brachiatum]
MPSKRLRSTGVVQLPKGVHRVLSRGREYFYWSPGRGTPFAEKPIRLPDDTSDPKFWVALREAQGKTNATGNVLTVEGLIDLYLDSAKFRGKGVGTKDQYTRQLKILRAGYGDWVATRLRPNDMRRVVEEMEDRPGAANNFLGTMRALSTWALARGHVPASFTEGVEPFDTEGGHKPWTDMQIAAAHAGLTGMLRRGVMLGLYTGQRGSDVVRLGWTDLDEGGLRLAQQKTKREVWCPVVPELAAEMTGWEKRPGPFLLQADGRPYTRKRLSIHFDAARAEIPELAGATLHGLRATAVVRLRRAGLSTAQIQDVIGMSMAMIERYSRFADRKASGQAAIIHLAARANKG